jgi:hypothetical protein
MSVLSVKNLQNVLIGKNIDRTASVQITDPSNATTYIANGEIVVLDNEGAVATSAITFATSPWIPLVQRSGDELIITPRIYGDKVTQYAAAGADAQGTEQIYHIGYNGTAGALDVSTAEDRYVTIATNHNDEVFSEQKQKNTTVVTGVDATTALGVAKELVRNLNIKYLRNGIPVKAAMLNSGAAAILTGAATVAVTHGSAVIVPNAAITNVGFGAGTLIRIGVTGSAVGTTIPVYEVKEAHPTIANAWILTSPYVGPSNSALAVANIGVVTAGASYGVRYTGANLTSDKDYFKFKRVSFTVHKTGLGTTPLYKTQEATYGVGDGRMVAQEEAFCKGFEGALNRMSVPLPSVTFDAVGTVTSALNTTYGDSFVTATQLYETLMISHFTQNTSHTIAVAAPMPQVIKLFLYPAAAQNKGAASDTVTVLDAWMLTVPNAYPALAASFS